MKRLENMSEEELIDFRRVADHLTNLARVRHSQLVLHKAPEYQLKRIENMIREGDKMNIRIQQLLDTIKKGA